MNTIKKVLQVIGIWPWITIIYDETIYFSRQINLMFKLLFSKQLNSKLFCFFNSYSTGGAEKVQYQIVKSVNEVKPIVFFLNYAENDHFKAGFEQVSTVVNLYSSIKRNDIFRIIFLKIISFRINKIHDAVVFGGDSTFYIQLIPYLNNNIKVVDIFHSRVHEHEVGTETWSLPVTNRINTRICISQKLKNDFIEWYSRNKLPSELSKRLKVIYNYTEIPKFVPEKTDTEDIIVLFLCRKDTVKRIHLAAKIAKKLHNKGFKFFFIGSDLIDDVPFELQSAITFTGNISNEKERDSYYEKSHILLMTSSREGTPMTIMEAMGFGVVPLSTNVGGISEMVSNGKEGILLEMLNDEEVQVSMFCEKLLQLSLNRNIIKQLGHNAREKAKSFFSKEKFESEYRSVLLSK